MSNLDHPIHPQNSSTTPIESAKKASNITVRMNQISNLLDWDTSEQNTWQQIDDEMRAIYALQADMSSNTSDDISIRTRDLVHVLANIPISSLLDHIPFLQKKYSQRLKEIATQYNRIDFANQGVWDWINSIRTKYMKNIQFIELEIENIRWYIAGGAVFYIDRILSELRTNYEKYGKIWKCTIGLRTKEDTTQSIFILWENEKKESEIWVYSSKVGISIMRDFARLLGGTIDTKNTGTSYILEIGIPVLKILASWGTTYQGDSVP